MLSSRDTPDDAYWTEVGGDSRLHPYGMHKTVNRNAVEVVKAVVDDNNNPKRWVLVRDGTHEAWVRIADADEYGYPLRPAELVSKAELKAINLKHEAIQDGSSVQVETARTLVDTGGPDQVRHGLVALYYAAKADPDVTDADVDNLREVMHEHTRHVDTSHEPTVRGILEDVIGDEEENGFSAR